MNIGFEVIDIKKRHDEEVEKKILQLVDVWDHEVTEVMRECVRIFDSIVITPQDDHDCISFKTEQKMIKLFRHFVKEIISRDDYRIEFVDNKEEKTNNDNP